MEIEYLREFAVVAQMESFSKAAEELCVSQSALSKHIIALERELGTQLLIRNSRNVEISPAGAQILPLAAQIYELQNKIRVAAARESRKEKTFVRIASIPVMAQYDITGALARFQRQYPDVTLEVEECEQHDILRSVREGDCELAFTRLGEREEDMDYLPFYQDHLVAVVSRNHPLAVRESITLEELRGENLLCLDHRTGLYKLCTDLLTAAGLPAEFVYTGHRPENIVALAAQDMGIALLMKGHTDYIRSNEVATIDIMPRVNSTICLMRRKDRRMTPAAGTFWRIFAEKAEEGTFR